MAHWARRRLQGFEDRTALVWRGAACSYAELLSHATSWRDRLSAWGLVAGDCVGWSAEVSPQGCGLMLALWEGGYVSVPMSPRALERHPEMLEIAGVRAMIRLDGQDQATVERRSTTVQHPLVAAIRDEGEAGLILFTSGSSGEPKAALHVMSSLVTEAGPATQAWISIAFLLLDHIGGINTVFRILLSGGTAVVPGSRQPQAVCAAIERHRVSLLPTTPTFLRMMLISGAMDAHDLSSLRYITYGTEPMSDSVLAAVTRALPKVRFKQTYGMTELAIFPTRSERRDSRWFSIGDAVETRVEDGRLWIRTSGAMRGYLNAASRFDADGWFDTGDRVRVREDGYMQVLGRGSEMINVGGEKVVPSEIESVILEVDGVADVTVSGRRNIVTGQVVVAHVQPLPGHDSPELTERVLAHCRARLDRPFKVPAAVRIVAEALHGERFKKERTSSR